MKSFSVKAVLVLLIIFFSFLAPVPAICDQYLDQIQSKIKNLEQEESDYEAAINFWKESLSLLQSGNYVVFPSSSSKFVGMPVPKKKFEEFLILETLSGEMKPSEIQGWSRASGRLTREMLAQAPGEIRRLEREQEKIKGELSSILDERARLRESRARSNQLGGDGSRPLANQPRGCTWQACECQWLADTCSEGAVKGTTRESCEKSGGTYWHTNGHCGKGICAFSKNCPMPGHYCCK
jgi:hypothetical protein